MEVFKAIPEKRQVSSYHNFPSSQNQVNMNPQSTSVTYFTSSPALKEGEADPLLSLTLPVLMGHWPVRGSYQTYKGESRYSTRSMAVIKSATVTDRI
ncbi:hypothetical protein J6590_040494 [Homalodisca vitripennis]|nr:hypothetical protein J6590_040494 [Homalodisca vitripennis]